MTTCLALDALGIDNFSTFGTTGVAVAGLLSLTVGPDLECALKKSADPGLGACGGA